MGNRYVQKFLRYGVGPLSILGALAMGWTSEFMSRSGVNDLTQVRPLVSVVEAGRVDPAHDGKLVYVTGAITAAPIVDADSGLTCSALRLSRQVHMLQWSETRKDITRLNPSSRKYEHDHYEYSYSLEWREKPVDSSLFHRSGKTNPEAPVLPKPLNVTAQGLKIGAYRLSAELIKGLSSPNPAHLPSQAPTAAGSWDAKLGQFFPGLGKGSEPVPGTVRFTYQVSDLPAEASALAQQKGDELVAYPAPSGRPLALCRVGKIEMEAFFQGEAELNRGLGWFFRLLDGLALLFGVVCLGAGRGWSWGRRLGLALGLWLVGHALPNFLSR